MTSRQLPPNPQYLLSDALHAELLHTFGAYRLAGERIDALLTMHLQPRTAGDPQEQTAGGSRPPEDLPPAARQVLRGVLEQARGCNERLLHELHDPEHAAGDPSRHPAPCEQPPTLDGDLLLEIRGFYEVAVTALSAYEEKSRGGKADERAANLGRLLAVVHDPQLRTAAKPQAGSPATVNPCLPHLRERMGHRLELVEGLLEDCPPRPQRAHPVPDAGPVLVEHLGEDRGGRALYLTILRALNEAHMHMHHAEHLRGKRFGEMFCDIPETDAKMRLSLHYSLALNTFAFVAARSMPWVFAQDTAERDRIQGDYETCCHTLTPTFCMWIACQVSMLALHRRAYGYWTLGDPDRGFRDFYKLTRLLRDLRGRAAPRAGRAPGTRTLIEGLTSIAENHIGRIYRSQHAHRIALRYFDRASQHVRHWEDHEEVGEIFKNSRWRVSLLVSQGKANYELGRAKQSLLHYARAWRAFLLLAESEGHSRANLEVVRDLIEWLEPIKDEPEVSKTELSGRLLPLIDQFETVSGPNHLRLLASEIIMHVGHLLFILKLPPLHGAQEGAIDEQPAPDHKLAERCLQYAALLDPTSTLIAADLRQIRLALERSRNSADEQAGETEEAGEDAGAAAAAGAGVTEADAIPIAEHWTAGGGRFEEAARVIEYILERLLDGSAPRTSAAAAGEDDGSDRRKIARALLGSFLAHTDSSNVKHAQVYQYLMLKSRGFPREAQMSTPTIDFVCLRRYSSFFPFLPRPAAFRAQGGGYLVQVCEPGGSAGSGEPANEPFGIAIDPGPSFLDNLYRCGYSLADIQMVILTHDHADHSASLDALLALMGYRMSLGEVPFNKKQRLTIVGNESIVARYQFYNEKHPVFLDDKGRRAKRRDAVRVVTFEEIEEVMQLEPSRRRERMEEMRLYLPVPSLRIERVQTLDHDDAAGHISQGFLLSMGESKQQVSILFTGDTGAPPKEGDPDQGHYYAPGDLSLRDAAARADVVVAHLSSVPLRELRELAGLNDGADELTQQFTALWDRVAEQVRTREATPGNDASDAGFLLRQLQFGFRTLAPRGENQLAVSPLSPTSKIREQPEKHLYLTGILDLAEHMAAKETPERPALLLIGELREELGTFRTRIASHVTKAIFQSSASDPADPGDAGEQDSPRRRGMALTTDIGLRLRLARPNSSPDPDRSSRAPDGTCSVPSAVSILCTTCDLDNDLIAPERFHAPNAIREVCVKGENEGVFYNCLQHDPGRRRDQPWLESVERFDVFRE